MEHYCSLQISQLLVKLGFNQKTMSVYKWGTACKNGKWRQAWIHIETDFCASADYDEIPRPTHAEAIEWLRRYKKVLIGVQACVVSQIPYTYEAIIEWIDTDDCQRITIAGKDHFGYKTPFKATEAALKFVLRDLLKN